MTTVNVNKNNTVQINATAGAVRYKNESELMSFIFVLKNGIAFTLKQQFAARTNADFERLDNERRQYEKVLSFLERVHSLRF
jgi:hypothetical protein